MPGKATIRLLVVLAAVPIVSLLLFVAGAFVKTTHDGDWERFNQHTVSRFFKIPSQATILHAEEHKYYIGGYDFIVRFQLPKKHTPKEWVRQIAHDSGIGEQHRKNKFEYDKGGDIYRVKYLADKRMYEVQYHWD